MALSPDEIEDVAVALCARSHDGSIRPMLLDRIPPRLWGRVPRYSAVIDQYRADLQTLRETTLDGDVPAIAIYLENAARLLDPAPIVPRLERLAARARQGPTRVVLFGPRGPTGWEARHPGAVCLAADASTGRWHREERPGGPQWVRAHQAVERIGDELRHHWGDVVVYASMPYSLGAILGNSLLNLPRARCRFFQAEGPADRIVWVDYGPRPDVDAAATPVLGELATVPGRKDILALTCGITWRLDLAEVDHGLEVAGASGATRIDIGPQTSGHDALADSAAVERAVQDLEATIDQLVRRGAHALHIFYSGPLAVLQRAAGKLHQPSTRIILHERSVGGTYWPAVCFEGGRARVLGPGPETDERAGP